MPNSRTILPAPKLLNLISVRADSNAIILSARASASTARCPVCGKRSGRVHSRYTRTLADLPKEQHERRVQEILDAIPDEHKGWLERKLRVVSEPSLNQMLHEILRDTWASSSP